MGMFDFLRGKKKAWHHVIEVSDDDFEAQVLQRSYKQPLMVDFWATWCQPCRQLSPVLERIATEQDSKVHLVKVETSEAPEWSARMGIQSIPHVKMFWQGKVVGEFRGLQFDANIRKWIDEKVDAGPPRSHIRIPRKAEDRITKGTAFLKEGKGFEASLMLRELEESEAQTLYPLAQWLWDVADGDALISDDVADALSLDVVDCLEAGDLAAASAKLDQLVGAVKTDLSDVQAGIKHLAQV